MRPDPGAILKIPLQTGTSAERPVLREKESRLCSEKYFTKELCHSPSDKTLRRPQMARWVLTILILPLRISGSCRVKNFKIGPAHQDWLVPWVARKYSVREPSQPLVASHFPKTTREARVKFGPVEFEHQPDKTMADLGDSIISWMAISLLQLLRNSLSRLGP
jgi:hypothetical protein